MSTSSMASSERVVWRDSDVWSRSTMAAGTFSGNPSLSSETKKKAKQTGTTAIPTK